MHPVYNATSHKCECEWIINPCATILCGPTRKPVYVPTTGLCDCQLINTSCTGIFCIAEQHPVFNTTTGICECEWIPGLEPGQPITERETPTLAPVPLPSIVIPRPTCKGIVCISEKHPVFNATSGHCECEWIDGFGPTLSNAESVDK